MMPTAFVTSPRHAAHYAPDHPERPERLDRILEILRADDVWDRLQHFEGLSHDEAEEAARRVHPESYLERLRLSTQKGHRLDPDTYLAHDSYEAALESLGGVLAAADAVMMGEVENAFAAVRPPGHHATPTQAMGFCLLSNVAIAAEHLRVRHGAERVAVVDFDVHHGNGTEAVFFDRADVLTVSLHQAPLWPGSGGVEVVGSERGRGATVNVPLPPATGDAGYLRAMTRVVVPALRRFRPDVLLVSAGYDAHDLDPLAGQRVTCTGFGRIVLELLEAADALCDGRAAFALEGGYHLDALAHGVLTTLRLLDDPTAEPSDPFDPPPADGLHDAQDAVVAAAEVHGLG